MTTPKLTPAQVRALLWLAETPGELRFYIECLEVDSFVFNSLYGLGLADWNGNRRYCATPAGLALAKEVG